MSEKSHAAEVEHDFQDVQRQLTFAPELQSLILPGSMPELIGFQLAAHYQAYSPTPIFVQASGTDPGHFEQAEIGIKLQLLVRTRRMTSTIVAMAQSHLNDGRSVAEASDERKLRR